MAESGQDAGIADCRPGPPVSPSWAERSSPAPAWSRSTVSPSTCYRCTDGTGAAAALALGRTIDRLAEARPAFISVTFGAGGSSRDRSLTVLRYMLENTDVEPMAHLTCVGSSHAVANRLVREFLDAGITSFLALRGDPPAGADPDAGIGDLGSAAELVQLIHRVQEEREPFARRGAEVGGALVELLGADRPGPEGLDGPLQFAAAPDARISEDRPCGEGVCGHRSAEFLSLTSRLSKPIPSRSSMQSTVSWRLKV